jgi:hypothetical protein
MKEQENNFKNAPIGSQIVFTSLDPRSNARVYEHENAIKLGSYQFIAHGIKRHDPFVTREQIYDLLAKDAVGTKKADDAYKKSHVRLDHAGRTC